MVYIMVALSQTKGVYKMFNVSDVNSKEYAGLFIEITISESIMLVDLMNTKSGNSKANTVTRLEVGTIKDAIFIANKLDIPFKING